VRIITDLFIYYYYFHDSLASCTGMAVALPWQACVCHDERLCAKDVCLRGNVKCGKKNCKQFVVMFSII
jgi:hypothetical protein